MNTIGEGRLVMKLPGQKLCNDGSWHKQCGRFVCRYVTGADPNTGAGLGASRPTAWDACLASGPILSTDYSKAPRGSIGWYRNRGAEPKPSHVAMHLSNGRLAMASDAVTTAWGNQSGTCGWEHYTAAKPAMEYVGFTYDFVGQVLTDARIVIRLLHKPELYLLTSASTRHHLTPDEWAPLKAKKLRAIPVSASVLAHFKLDS